ncbi:MAG: M48 family metallopeptidase [Nitrospira sp.]|nr:M48 family metallopeptidase [bacterium]MBL7048786.1 M48 family metallopeptidase [Nitrospira sp.]
MDLYLIIIIAGYCLVSGFGYWLDYLNLVHLGKFGAVIPEEFEGHIDQDLLVKTSAYNIENARFGFVSSIFNNAAVLTFMLVLLNIYNNWIKSLDLFFIASGIVFFLLMTYAETLISMPFSLYHTFRIENRYGFNTMTFRLWIIDALKSLAVSTILLALLVSAGLYIIQKSPDLWWLWLWSFFLFFSIVMMYVAPYVIEPLFHKFSPIGDESLESDIRGLMEKAGIKVSRVFKVDASRRTRHTNAYFTGIGRVKRIVLYDTLLETMDREEILAVLAHEAGHWKKKHLLKHLVTSEVFALVILYIAWHVLKNDMLSGIFHLTNGTFFSEAVLLGFVASILAFPLGPVFNYISRRHEEEADRYSYEMTGSGEGMTGALVKLSTDNLSNLHPHPLYALFHYSHPPVLQRIRAIKGFSRADSPD